MSNVKSECIFSGGHEWRETETQCRVASNAAGRETGCFCRGDAREEFDAPEKTSAEMGGVARGSRGGIGSAAGAAAVFFAWAGFAPVQHGAAGCAVAAGGSPAPATSNGNAARNSHDAKNIHAGKIDGAIVCTKGGCDDGE